MTDYKLLYDRFRHDLPLGADGVLSPGELQGTDAILKYCEARGLKAAATAYILATAYHETAGTMQPIDERGGNGYFTLHYGIEGNEPARARREGNVNLGDGPRFHGRGMVQVTWRGNYRRIGGLLGIDLENNPEKAKELDVAVKILVEGMVHGWFTGVGLSHFLPATGIASESQFEQCRHIVNGIDQRQLIAGHAIHFQTDLQAAGWPL